MLRCSNALVELQCGDADRFLNADTSRWDARLTAFLNDISYFRIFFRKKDLTLPLLKTNLTAICDGRWKALDLWGRSGIWDLGSEIDLGSNISNIV